MRILSIALHSSIQILQFFYFQGPTIQLLSIQIYANQAGGLYAKQQFEEVAQQLFGGVLKGPRPRAPGPKIGAGTGPGPRARTNFRARGPGPGPGSTKSKKTIRT